MMVDDEARMIGENILQKYMKETGIKNQETGGQGQSLDNYEC